MMGWTVLLWLLAFLWAGTAVVCEFLPGVDHPPDHAQLMGALFLIAAILSGKLDAMLTEREKSLSHSEGEEK